MAGRTRCLKSLFMSVNTSLVIAAGLIFIFTIVLDYNGSSQNQNAGMAVVNTQLFLRVAGILAVAAFGIYGVWKDKKWPLIVYITACVIGVVVFLMEGALMAMARSMMSFSDPDSQRSPFLQGVRMAVDCMLAISFVPAALGISGIILAAMIIKQLGRQALVLPDVEGQLPEYSELYPVTKE